MCGSGPMAKAHPLDVVYAAKMRAIAEAYPDDPDVTTLYAEAVMIATRDDWWDRTTGAISVWKNLTTPGDPTVGILEGLGRIENRAHGPAGDDARAG